MRTNNLITHIRQKPYDILLQEQIIQYSALIDAEIQRFIGAGYPKAEIIHTLKKNLALFYYCTSYIKIYYEWEQENLSEFMTISDYDMLSRVAFFDYEDFATNYYIHGTIKADKLSEMAECHIEHPAGAAPIISDKERQNFILFLNTVFKPALIDMITSAKSGEFQYIIDLAKKRNELHKDFQTCEDKEKRLELQNEMNDIFIKQHGARKTFFEYMDIYAEKSSVKNLFGHNLEDLSNNIFISSQNFMRLYNPPEFRTIATANTTTKTGKQTLNIGAMGEISVTSNKRLIRIEREFETKFKGFRPSTTRLLYALQAELTNAPSKDAVKLSTKEYIAAIGKNPDNETDFYNAMKSIKEDLNSLHLSVSVGALTVELVQATDINKDFITVLFTDIYKGICYKSAMTTFPRKLLNSAFIPDTAMYIGMKLSDNYFNDNNKTGQNTIISVKCLLDAVPTIPRYEDVVGRNYRSQIVIPFEKALDALQMQGILSNWEYCNAKKRPLTDEQCENAATYSTFIDLYISYDIIVDDATLSDQQARRDKIAEKKKAAKENKQAKDAANIVKADRIKKKESKTQ